MDSERSDHWTTNSLLKNNLHLELLEYYHLKNIFLFPSGNLVWSYAIKSISTTSIQKCFKNCCFVYTGKKIWDQNEDAGNWTFEKITLWSTISAQNIASSSSCLPMVTPKITWSRMRCPSFVVSRTRWWLQIDEARRNKSTPLGCVTSNKRESKPITFTWLASALTPGQPTGNRW